MAIGFLSTHRYDHWLTLARLLWGGLVVWSLSLFFAAVPASFVILPCDIAIIGSAGASESLASFAFPVQAYIIFRLGVDVLLVLVCTALALVIFAYKSTDRIALLASLMLVVGPTGASCVTTGLWESQPAWRLPLALTWDLGFACFYLFLYLFPDGRFVPYWTRWLALIVVMVEILLPFGLWGMVFINWDFVWIFLIATCIGAQVYRYRHVSGPVQRHQTRWVVFGVTTAGLFYIIDTLLYALAPVESSQLDTPSLIAAYTSLLFHLLFSLCIPLSISIAVLRYRLWDIDIIIRRTVVYTILTVLLALVYFSSVVVLQGLARTLTGSGQNQLVSVASTLAIAALFTPLRRRIQSGIDRRFYRRKYDAEKTLDAFRATVRAEVDLDRLTVAVQQVVKETMQPAQVALWLNPTNDRQPHPDIFAPQRRNA